VKTLVLLINISARNKIISRSWRRLPGRPQGAGRRANAFSCAFEAIGVENLFTFGYDLTPAIKTPGLFGIAAAYSSPQRWF